MEIGAFRGDNYGWSWGNGDVRAVDEDKDMEKWQRWMEIGA